MWKEHYNREGREDTRMSVLTAECAESAESIRCFLVRIGCLIRVIRAIRDPTFAFGFRIDSFS